MAEMHGVEGGAAGGGGGPGSDIDWIAAERSPEFRELVRRKNAFIIPATIFYLAWYFGFIILAGYAHDFMGKTVFQGFKVGYLIALTNFVMVWVLGALYLRQARKVFDPLAQRAARRAVEVGRRPEGDIDGGTASRERS
jgi:uncharacterized membrane protein (DUF485 family)